MIADATHSWDMLDFNVPDLNVPFAALNLHKWIGAPLGCGAIYIRGGLLEAIDRYLRDRTWSADGAETARAWPEVQIMAPPDASMSASITAFRLHGRADKAGCDAIVNALMQRFGVFTVTRPGLDAEVVHVTPALFTRKVDVARLYWKGSKRSRATRSNCRFAARHSVTAGRASSPFDEFAEHFRARRFHLERGQRVRARLADVHRRDRLPLFAAHSQKR